MISKSALECGQKDGDLMQSPLRVLNNMINIVSPSRYSLEKKELKKSVSVMLDQKGIDDTIDLNIIFVGKRKMKSIALTYKKEDVALPVLSFNYSNDKNAPSNLLGEIFLCYPQVVLLAAERNKKVNKMIIELIKHGIDNVLNEK